MDVKTKTFFQIPPKRGRSKWVPLLHKNRVVFMGEGFDLDDISLITEPVMVRDLHYTFDVLLGYSEERKRTFEFKRKQDCLMAQRELSRAWCQVEEFADVPSDEDVHAGESKVL